MACNIEISAEAENDLDEVVTYYLEQETPTTAMRFLDLYEQIEEAIADRPLSFPIIHPSGLRRARFYSTFKCSVLFVLKVDTAYIISVFMERRNPEDWEGRIA
ncbi:type II toxin-antitoxin system RelE/ParE family toxin [Flavilitoribacter nigricans]|uniref:Type II toxin-antitoxin system RelE/ParE family toxin n=1 Tax=Flavilitoribacter nigricans (strain ATCC 23147 / DSM 23189 / NBRC 102662 / NCIMB 1420 / SS-2) TaxID=1122177 RepID=A0A2D0MXC5_FLAN2|nr:type II toxin-antitoxin system RelE/ParE family toxin [Flavilitoribacter nigricans]PHN00921.1 hypothetical protein CRP01_39695 [Flavilitoribacter nigricans DSM 23189 = NBRC 102662]